MRILLTGATGYIGKRLLPVLVEEGHHVICCVRDKDRFSYPKSIQEHISVVEIDFLKTPLKEIDLEPIDAAYYLIHSMASKGEDFGELEARSARNFLEYMKILKPSQVIYLSGIVNEDKLSKHLASRKTVEDILSSGEFALTTLRAGIIVGSGSASFEIIRDLVEKLPVMITPKWLNTKSQPIAVRNVIEFLSGVLLNQVCYDKSFDIGGPEVLSYKEMLLRFAKVRDLKRWIYTVPVMTPRLSSYWLYFVTSTSYPLAVNLVDSMKIEVIAKPNQLAENLGIKLIAYEESIERAFARIEQSEVISSWKDAISSGKFNRSLSEFMQVPTFGCFKDERSLKVNDVNRTLEKIWQIGGENGWYYGNALWELRGFLDKLIGGVGLRRGRTNTNHIQPGDALDFWRVLLAEKENRRLLLFAEMKLPGEAWLEFFIDDKEILHQTATFRPRGLLGRLYWYSVLPFHGLIFNGMIKALAK